jgi:hypothetical protein
MFDDLRAAFSEALDNFNKELSRGQVPETVDKLFAGMKSEIADEKAQVAGLEDQLEQALAQTKRVTDAAATARRREEMARGIDDYETAKLAAEYAAKQEDHSDVLNRKTSALREELQFRRRTVEEMFARFHEAKGKRDELTTTTGRSEARASISAADNLFGKLDRMAEKLEGNHAHGEAAETFDDLDLDKPSEFRVEIDDDPPEKLDVDAALEELKRRMRES